MARGFLDSVCGNNFSLVTLPSSAPRKGHFCLVCQWKPAISFGTKRSTAGTMPKERPGKPIANFGSILQRGGNGYYAPKMRAMRASEQPKRSGRCARYTIKDGAGLTDQLKPASLTDSILTVPAQQSAKIAQPRPANHFRFAAVAGLDKTASK